MLYIVKLATISQENITFWFSKIKVSLGDHVKLLYLRTMRKYKGKVKNLLFQFLYITSLTTFQIFPRERTPVETVYFSNSVGLTWDIQRFCMSYYTGIWNQELLWFPISWHYHQEGWVTDHDRRWGNNGGVKLHDPAMAQGISGPLIQEAGQATKKKVASRVKNIWKGK